MPINIEMPKLSDTMTEGTLVRWLKKVGDKIQVGDVLAEVETDKATMEMEAFDEGILSQVLVGEGQVVQVGQHLGILTQPGESLDQSADQPATKPSQSASSPAAEKSPAATTAVQPSEPTPQVQTESPATGRTKASPLAKKIAAQKGIDLSRVSGTGPGGRIVQADVLAAPQTTTASPPVSTPIPSISGQERRIPLTGMRRTIAARLLEAKTTIPHFYLEAEIDAEPLTILRQQLNAALEAAGQPKFTVNDFILKAAAVAAARVPQVNGSFAGDSVIQFADVHLACAVAIDDGLVTPVIRNADQKSLGQISAAIKDLAARARSKKLKPEEYQGGTLTVSNLGGYGVEKFFAIINPPQSLIVSVGAIVRKPVVNDQGAVVPGQRITVGLSCDHRVVDGAIGANYLAELKKGLEAPATLLL
ncbi:MAG: pyruvate dehydrogenase complex dihydrolipoamide acetyltransferase [Verrucomicrobia bacterium]|nr:pyruvate dehydrogenase complex dihydrolipoamide acetyltransferase [Verrucomicrobiota bacterium]